MGNNFSEEALSREFYNYYNLNGTVNQLKYQLNHLFDTIPPNGPINTFATNLLQKLNTFASQIQTLQNNEPTTQNLSSINSALASLTALVQTLNTDVIQLQNQSVSTINLQDIQTSLTNITNGLTSLTALVSGVDCSALQQLVNTIEAQVNNLITTVAGKVDKVTTINGKSLSSNITLTKSDIGLPNVTNDAQLKRSANDYVTFGINSTINPNDILLIENAEVGGIKYASQVSNLPITTATVTALATKVDQINITPTTAGAINRSVNITTNAQGQVTTLTDALINITPAQANLANVQNVDTTNIANTFVRNSFVPLNSQVIVNDSGLNALQKLQGQINTKVVPMVGATATLPGVVGLVPAPIAGQQAYFLRGDGTWNQINIPSSSINSSLNPAIINTLYFCDTSASSFTITLPIPTTSGGKIVFIDVKDTFTINPVLIAPSGGCTINGISAPFTLSNTINEVYFSLPNIWIVNNQITQLGNFSSDSPSYVGPAPTITSSAYTTLATLPTQLTPNYQWYDILIQNQFTGVLPTTNYAVTLSLTILNASNNSVVNQIYATINMFPSSSNVVINKPVFYRLFTVPNVTNQIRIDAQISGGTPTSLPGSSYEYTFGHEIHGRTIQST